MEIMYHSQTQENRLDFYHHTFNFCEIELRYLAKNEIGKKKKKKEQTRSRLIKIYSGWEVFVLS